MTDEVWRWWIAKGAGACGWCKGEFKAGERIMACRVAALCSECAGPYPTPPLTRFGP